MSFEPAAPAAVDAFADHAGGLDAVVNNAAWMPRRTPTTDVDRALLSGRVIFVSSALGTAPNAGLFPIRPARQESTS